MEDVLKRKCATWKVPSMRQLKSILEQSKKCQAELMERADKVEKRIATLNGEEEWMTNKEKE